MLVLLAACSSSTSSASESLSADSSGGLTEKLTASEDAGSQSGDGTVTGPTASEDGESGSTGDTSTGPILDVGGATGEGGETGSVEVTCENIDMVDATSIGCEFWSTSWEAPDNYGLGIGIGNPGDDVATVTLERSVGGSVEVITTETLQTQESKIINVNGPGGVLGPGTVVVTQGLNAERGFRLTSDVPITAMQIAPLGGAETHVPEASLLLPTNSLGDSHFATGYTELISGGGRVAVVGTVDGTTVTTTAGTVPLDAFDVHLFTLDDAMGFFVGADQKVAVFSGSRLTYVPEGQGAADHLQEQVVPAASWGTSYVGGRHPVRITASNSSPENVVWRVMAGQDDTTVTLTPDVAGGPISIATAGQFVEFQSDQSFLAESDKPFMLVQYMTGCINVVPVPLDNLDPCNEPTTGDPYMIQMPPIEQWLPELPFLTDTSYPRDFVVIMREVGTSVSLACLGEVDASHFTPIAGTSYEVGTVELDDTSGEGNCGDGAQFLTASDPVGVIVGGLDYASSYGYAGGLAFENLWEPPFEPPG
jgi:hypothetical protein